MTTIQDALLIAGAAEGSFFNSTDLRYVGSFANANSGLSFGIFQFDVAVNGAAQNTLQSMLHKAVVDQKIDAGTSRRLYKGASQRNAKVHLTAADRTTLDQILGMLGSPAMIDAIDRQRAQFLLSLIDEMIRQAGIKWAQKKAAPAKVLTDGEAECLYLFAYILASYNRYSANFETFQKWLDGENVKTKGFPHGLQLKKPPMIFDIHQFFNSLRIWDGTQGRYEYLRERLDPVLSSITGRADWKETDPDRGHTGTPLLERAAKRSYA